MHKPQGESSQLTISRVVKKLCRISGADQYCIGQKMIVADKVLCKALQTAAVPPPLVYKHSNASGDSAVLSAACLHTDWKVTT